MEILGHQLVVDDDSNYRLTIRYYCSVCFIMVWKDKIVKTYKYTIDCSNEDVKELDITCNEVLIKKLLE